MLPKEDLWYIEIKIETKIQFTLFTCDGKEHPFQTCEDLDWHIADHFASKFNWKSFCAECNLTICQSEVPSCENGNKLVIGYSAISCCPEYRCGERDIHVHAILTVMAVNMFSI